MRHKLTLETDYKVNGNSSGRGIDTLAIAVDGRDNNDIYSDDFEGRDATERYVIENYDYETDMLKAATKNQLKLWLNNAKAQAEALLEYKEVAKEAALSREDETSALATKLQAALDEYEGEQYKEWLNGDYRGNWDGIMKMASKRYSEGEIEFTEDEGEVSVEFTKEYINSLMNNGDYEIKTQKDAREYLEASINSDARAQNNKRKAENEARKVERERVAAYKAVQAKEAEERRQERIREHLKAI